MFQCLLIDGENAGPEAIRNAETFVITDDEFQEFLDRHSSLSCLVPESNEAVSKIRHISYIGKHDVRSTLKTYIGP